MTQPLLRITQPDDLPAPRVDDDSTTVLNEAIETLARLRTPYWLGDSGVRLHALASLTAQAQRLLPHAIDDARDQGLTWTEIAHLLNISTTTAQRHHRRRPRPLTRITRIMPMSGRIGAAPCSASLCRGA